MATMKRCLVPMTLSGRWGSEHLWPGLEVNVERELAPGFTVAAAIAGREDCFEDVTAAPDEPVAEPTNDTAVRPRRAVRE